MSKQLLWKLGLIVAVVVAALAFSYPPEDKINLGLDLRGGAHILIQVESASTIDSSKIGIARRGSPLSEWLRPSA